METRQSIFDYWFGSNPDDAGVAAERSTLWWSKDASVDSEIRSRFRHYVKEASSGRLDGWAATPRGRLALILLTDQFPRNMFRDTPEAYSYDPVALSWCLQGLETGADRLLRPIERVFFYLPLEHSESLPHQNESVRLFQDLARGVGSDHQTVFEGYVDYATRHRDIIARFGRFPHRNRTLGRKSTPEERLFLAKPGPSF